MKWYFHRLPGAVELTLYTGSMYYAAAFALRGRYRGGRRWWFGRAACLCAWYGPDLTDGCSDCGGGLYTPITDAPTIVGTWDEHGTINWQEEHGGI